MVGFMVAQVQLNLPFTFSPSLVISNPDSKGREGWSYIDNNLPADKVCDWDSHSPSKPTTQLPVGLHYCKRYLLDWVRIHLALNAVLMSLFR